MPATVWKGQLAFGLVTIPVKLYRAARAERISFRQIYRSVPPPEAQAPDWPEPADADEEHSGEAEPAPPARSIQPAAPPAGSAGSEDDAEDDIAPVARVRHAAVEEDGGRVLPQSQVLKGYEYEKDRYVVVTPEDLKRITPRTGREMQILEFVNFSEIDPVYLENSYYVWPDRNGERPYGMLYAALRETGYVALAQVAMHRREHIVILRPGKRSIIAHTMYYSDEVRGADEYPAEAGAASKKELDLSVALIRALFTAFEPEKYKDPYREQLQELIDARIAGRAIAESRAPAPKAPVIDILEALKKSLERAQKHPVSAQKGAVSERKTASREPKTQKRARRA
jgi:DNA end-binding protein Ku